MIVDDVLPRAPLPADPSFDDGHSSLFSSLLPLSLPLSPHSTVSFSRSLARSLALSHSLSLFSHGDTRSAPALHRYALGSGGSRV